MDVMQAIRRRQSVRSYLDRPIEDEKLRLILEAGRLAPSARNRQEWRFVVVRDKLKRQELMKAAKGQSFVGEAPIIIACCADDPDKHVMTCGQLCSPLDVAIAVDHIVLKAAEEGLGTCWVGAFYEGQVKQILGIPDNIRVIELLTLGYPKDVSLKEKDRLPFERIVMYESWRNK